MNTMDFEKQEKSGQAAERTNLTGIPSQMKEKFEHYSGLDFSDVRVHYNSSQPLQFHADAFTRGNQVHLGPGQESHLPHELGHVVQQKAGEVSVTGHEAGAGVNTSAALEHGADRIAGRAMSGAEAVGTFRQSGRVGEGVHQFWGKKRHIKGADTQADRAAAVPPPQPIPYPLEQMTEEIRIPHNVEQVLRNRTPAWYFKNPFNELDRLLYVAKQYVADKLGDDEQEDEQQNEQQNGQQNGQQNEQQNGQQELPHPFRESGMRVPVETDPKLRKKYTKLAKKLNDFELEVAAMKEKLTRSEYNVIPIHNAIQGVNADQYERDLSALREHAVEDEFSGALNAILLKVFKKQRNLIEQIRNEIIGDNVTYKMTGEALRTTGRLYQSASVVQEEIRNYDRYERYRGKEKDGQTKVILQLLSDGGEAGIVQEHGDGKAKRKLELQRKNYNAFYRRHPRDRNIAQVRPELTLDMALGLAPSLSARAWDLPTNDLFIDTNIEYGNRFTVTDISKKDKAAVAEISKKYNGKTPHYRVKKFIEYCKKHKHSEFLNAGNRKNLPGRARVIFKFTILAREIIQLFEAGYYFANIPVQNEKFTYDKNWIYHYNLNITPLSSEELKEVNQSRLEGKETKLIGFPSKDEYIHYLNNKVQHAINDNNEAQRKRYKKLLKKVR